MICVSASILYFVWQVKCMAFFMYWHVHITSNSVNTSFIRAHDRPCVESVMANMIDYVMNVTDTNCMITHPVVVC